MVDSGVPASASVVAVRFKRSKAATAAGTAGGASALGVAHECASQIVQADNAIFLSVSKDAGPCTSAGARLKRPRAEAQVPP